MDRDRNLGSLQVGILHGRLSYFGLQLSALKKLASLYACDAYGNHIQDSSQIEAPSMKLALTCMIA